MNKTQLIEAVSAKTGFKKKDSEAAVNSVFEAISEALKAGEKVQVSGFGSFDVKERAERKGLNPITKKEMTIAASKRPAFSASKALKDLLNK